MIPSRAATTAASLRLRSTARRSIRLTALKAIQDYVFTDGTAEDSVERRFAKSLDGSQNVFIYAKLPKGFAIPTPVGHYSPDWAIVFHEAR